MVGWHGKGLSLVVALGQLSFVSFSELTHRDGPIPLGRTESAVQSHDCGAKEVHIPIANLPHCVACSQSTQRVSTEARCFCTIDPPIVCTALVLEETAEPTGPDLHHSGKRGPPL